MNWRDAKKNRRAWRKVYITVCSEKDSLDRQTFWLEWMADNIGYHLNETGLRGQIFFSNLEQHLKHWKKNGYKLIFRHWNIKEKTYRIVEFPTVKKQKIAA